MKVSVVIAAYNIEKYIKRCLISITNQTLKDIEIIVVNDGSDDNTLNIIKKHKKKDNRIRIISKKNEGLVAARKSGFIIAKGEYILFVDGDDWLENTCLDVLYNNAKLNKSDIVLFNAILAYDDYNSKYKTFNMEKFEQKDLLKELFLNNIQPSIWAKFVSREFLTKNNIKFPNNISYGEDLATVSNWFINYPKVSSINNCLYNYYQRDNSITHVLNKRALEINMAIEFIKIKLEDKNLYNQYRNEFEYMAYLHLFIYKVISCSNLNEINKEIYIQFKSRKIDVNNNSYIKKIINTNSKMGKFRIKLYQRNYNLGRAFDFVRNMCK